MDHGTGDTHQSGLGANCWSQSRNLVRREKLSRSCMRATLRSVLPWSTATGCSSGAPPCCTWSQRARSHCGSTHETRNFVLHRFTSDWHAERRLSALFYFFCFILHVSEFLPLRLRIDAELRNISVLGIFIWPLCHISISLFGHSGAIKTH